MCPRAVQGMKRIRPRSSVRMGVSARIGILAMILPTCTIAAAEEPWFMGLGDLPGGEFFSMAFGVSADGSTVVGRGKSPSGIEAFRWTADDAMVGLGDLPGGDFLSEANAVSADGSVVVGAGRSELVHRHA